VSVALIFGTKKLRNIGSDLGGAVKGFKESVSSDTETTVSDETSETVEKKDTTE
jgi:sec-independent protein translocase protein TatA